jgi:hypothetical protein
VDGHRMAVQEKIDAIRLGAMWHWKNSWLGQDVKGAAGVCAGLCWGGTNDFRQHD